MKFHILHACAAFAMFLPSYVKTCYGFTRDTESACCCREAFPGDSLQVKRFLILSVYYVNTLVSHDISFNVVRLHIRNKTGKSEGR